MIVLGWRQLLVGDHIIEIHVYAVVEVGLRRRALECDCLADAANAVITQHVGPALTASGCCFGR